MKNRLIQFVLLATVSAGSASCLGDMDIIQKSKITTSNMWLDEGDATGALYGMYHQFRATFQTAMIYWGAVPLFCNVMEIMSYAASRSPVPPAPHPSGGEL